MHTFRDPRIGEEVDRTCIGPCLRDPGDHDDCFSILRDDADAAIVKTRGGGIYKLTYQTMSDLGWVNCEPVLKRSEKVALRLAEPKPARKLTPAMVTVATVLRRNGIASLADLKRAAEDRGTTIPALLRQLCPGDADQALADMGR